MRGSDAPDESPDAGLSRRRHTVLERTVTEPADVLPAFRVLVIGEALIDIVERGDSVVEHVGGSPANVALGLGRMGIPVGLLTYLAHDARGDAIADHLRTSGATVVEESFTAPRTSTARARISDDGHATYTFDLDWAVSDEPLRRSADIVHTGSIAAFLQPGADAVMQHLRRRPESEITFDPNIRPALIPDRAGAVERFEAVARLSTLVKMSDEDAEWLFPGLTLDAAIDAVLTLGPRVVAITRGGEGAIMATADHRMPIAAERASVVDTIGAGDTFMASLIASISTGGTAGLLPGALHALGSAAVRAAAITVSRAGADLPWRHELYPGMPAEA